MALPQDKIEKIAHQVIGVLHKRFETFPEDASANRNAPFHEAFLKAFQNRLEKHVPDIPILISLASWLHGLNTTLGQTFFEKTSHILCVGEKKEFTDLYISEEQQLAISDIITELKKSERKPELAEEERIIYQNNKKQDKPVSNFTADCFYDDGETIVAIELKTVKPNSGVFKNEKDKILSAKAGLKNRYPDKKIFFYLGFPFDPQSSTPTGSDKNTFMDYSIGFRNFFAPEEVLLADELWDFLSGETDTMQQILDIINTIASPQFIDKYNFINEPQNRIKAKEQYLKQLNEWHLYSEHKLVTNDFHLFPNVDKETQKKFNQTPFKNGKYNNDRF